MLAMSLQPYALPKCKIKTSKTKWLRMTRNGQSLPIRNFSNLFLTKVGQNDLEQPIFPDLQLFLSFPTKVAWNDSEWSILPDLQLFQSFPTEVAQNDSEQPNLPDSQFFQSFPTKVAQNDLEQPILPESQTKNCSLG